MGEKEEGEKWESTTEVRVVIEYKIHEVTALGVFFWLKK